MSSFTASLFAAVAMVPAMVGTVESTHHSLSLALCNGGSLTIEIPGQNTPPPGSQPCCVNKGCRSDEKRKRIDRAQ